MPPNPERQERMRQRREAMEADPELNAARESAGAAVLGAPPAVPAAPIAAAPAAPAPAPVAPRPVAPPLSQPPMGQPTVPGQPQMRARPAPGVRGGGGPPQRGARPDAAMPPARQVNPLGLSPGSPFKYEKGGPIKPISPNFSTTEFGIGTMHTRKGRGLIEDDLPSDLSSAKPGRFGAHAKGGSVLSFAKGGSANFGKDYRKK